MACDFIRLTNAPPEKFALIAYDFSHSKRPSYPELLISILGITGIAMVVFMAIAFILATSHFRRNILRFPAPFNRLTGFNAFWYSHHLLGLVYILLVIHGTFLYLSHQWYQRSVRTSKFSIMTKSNIPICYVLTMFVFADMDVHSCSITALHWRTYCKSM